MPTRSLSDADRLFLTEMLDAAKVAVHHHTFAFEFELWSTLIHYVDATAFRLLVIGESAGRVSKALREANPDIPWADMIGMRNRLAHGYPGASVRVIWETATESLPLLIPQLEHLLSKD